MADNSKASLAALRLLFSERSPPNGSHAEDVEELWRHLHGGDSLGFSVSARQITLAEIVSRNAGERLDTAADVSEFRTRQGEERRVVS